jgi:uncharacterized protein (DUF4415 family)
MSKQRNGKWAAARRKALRSLGNISEAEDAELRRAALADPDNPPLDETIFAKMRPAEEMHPDIVAWYRRTRGPQKAPTKQLVSLRLDRDLIAHFRKRGPGWQRRINDTLRKAARLRKKA